MPVSVRPLLPWLAAGLGLYLFGLLVMAPAGLLAWGLERAAGLPLRAYAMQGSLWRGEAARLDWQGAAGVTSLGRLSWRWQPWALLQGRLAWAVELDAPGRRVSAHLGYGLDGLSIESLQGQAPAWLLGRLAPALGLVHPSGELKLEAADLRLKRKAAAGALTLEWHAARSALVREPLGSFRLSAAATPEGALRLRLDTLAGPLLAQGEGLWRWGEGLEFNASLQPPAAQALAYAPALRLLGRADAGGVYRLEWRL